MLGHLLGGSEIQWGPMLIRDHRVWLPNGLPLIYDTLQWHVADPNNPKDRTGYRVRTRQGWQHMYGGKLVEQTTQALARVHIGECMKQIARASLPVKGMSHDEPWVMIPKGPNQDSDMQFCLDVISTPPSWLPNVPLAAEGVMGERYAK